MTGTRTILRNALLAFVLVSVGFMLGKHYGRAAGGAATIPARTNAETPLPEAVPETVRVYYLHTTFRCSTCNTIEALARDLVDTEFRDALMAGRLEWQEEDFQENPALAKAFDVTASCVVVARVRGERIVEFQRLDEVWTKKDDRDRFRAYLGDAIRAYLEPVP